MRDIGEGVMLYERAKGEVGLDPDQVWPEVEKTGILIHYTDSNNGRLSYAREISDHQMWRNMWKSDILHGFTVWQSGRVFESRCPWNAQGNGAIYNTGGGTYFGHSDSKVGIENQGVFRPDVIMDDLQYHSLLMLCVMIWRNAGWPLDDGVQRVWGHKQLPPCRDTDPWGKGTDCPANLLPQFVENGKLQSDIIDYIKHGSPKPKPVWEEKRMGCWQEKGTWIKSAGYIQGEGAKLSVDVMGEPRMTVRITLIPYDESLGIAEKDVIIPQRACVPIDIGALFNAPGVGNVSVVVEAAAPVKEIMAKFTQTLPPVRVA